MTEPDAGEPDLAKQARKAASKAAKAAAREKRAADPAEERKTCDLCKTPQLMLYRCTIDSTRVWRMVCPTCWPSVSGGRPDGDAQHPFYKYGGTWKLLKR